jgi:hypothetical protein
LYSVERRIEVREISFFPLSRVFLYIAFIVRC